MKNNYIRSIKLIKKDKKINIASLKEILLTNITKTENKQDELTILMEC